MAERTFYTDVEIDGELIVKNLSIYGEYSLPTTDGTAGYILATDGAGNVDFVNPGSLLILTAGSIISGTGLNWTQVSPGVLQGDINLTPFSTSNLVEGSRLYFTNERVDDRVATLIQTGTGLTWTYNDLLNTLTGNISLTPFTTSNLAEGVNLYFTNERVDDRVATLLRSGLAGTGPNSITWTYNDSLNLLTPTVSLAPFTTSNLAEGTNLYFTNERVDDRVAALIQNSATVTWTYNDLLNTLTANSTASPLEIQQNGLVIGTRGKIDFVDSSFISFSLGDDAINGKVVVQASLDPIYLEDLTDVFIGSPGPVAGDVLAFDGNNWALGSGAVIVASSGNGSSVRKDNNNLASGNYSTVSGGLDNTASGDYTTLSGGYLNLVADSYSTLSGGYDNCSTGFSSTVSGGQSNNASCTFSTIGGGAANVSANQYSTVSGGYLNSVSEISSSILGGEHNTVSGKFSSIAGGTYNTASNCYSSVVGGNCNTASGQLATVLGGCGNTASCENSAVFGKNITTIADDTFHVNQFAIMDQPASDPSNIGVLVRGTNGSINQRYLGGIFAQTADSATVTATISETTIIGTGVGALTVPANGFTVGDTFIAKLNGIISNVNGETIRIKVKETGTGTILADSGAVALSTTTTKNWTLEVMFTVRAIGSAGVAAIKTHGNYRYTQNTGLDLEGFGFNTLNTTTFNTTVLNTLDITVQWGSTNAGNSIYSDTFVLIKEY